MILQSHYNQHGGTHWHSLCHFYLGVSEPIQGLPWFTQLGYVDDQLITRYDSNTRRDQPQVPWVEKEEDSWFWEQETHHAREAEFFPKLALVILQSRYNQHGGLHTWQCLFGCALSKDRKQKGRFMQCGYDGQDFISLDKETFTWTAADDAAQVTKRKWEADPDIAKILKGYLEGKCNERLQKYLDHGMVAVRRRGKEGKGSSLWRKEEQEQRGCLSDLQIIQGEEAEPRWRLVNSSTHTSSCPNLGSSPPLPGHGFQGLATPRGRKRSCKSPASKSPASDNGVCIGKKKQMKTSAFLSPSEVAAGDVSTVIYNSGHGISFPFSQGGLFMQASISEGSNKSNSSDTVSSGGRVEPPAMKVTHQVGPDGLEILTCRAHGFYPKEIDATWRKDGEFWEQETFRGAVTPNSDGTYHMWLSIEIDPKEREHYRCHVDHESLLGPLDLAWEKPGSVPMGIIVSAILWAVAAGLLVAGIVFYVISCWKSCITVMEKRQHDVSRATREPAALPGERSPFLPSQVHTDHLPSICGEPHHSLHRRGIYSMVAEDTPTTGFQQEEVGQRSSILPFSSHRLRSYSLLPPPPPGIAGGQLRCQANVHKKSFSV
ncbi:major histocompatibility complex class I-related gene protein-like [Hemicordylus capensis]|uniref:major histocompatibility complex class I-related gene protein-like n=1 Tax=Hemicordylus capensis TaxID=884348 RepID=UPI002304068D|nr:major histocompatibility complex class I-related gene protein-like [Hemicordylus capensis]